MLKRTECSVSTIPCVFSRSGRSVNTDFSQIHLFLSWIKRSDGWYISPLVFPFQENTHHLQYKNKMKKLNKFVLFFVILFPVFLIRMSLFPGTTLWRRTSGHVLWTALILDFITKGSFTLRPFYLQRYSPFVLARYRVVESSLDITLKVVSTPLLTSHCLGKV
jgi:hypothetical protein